MTKVLTTAEYKKIEKKNVSLSGKIKLTLTKTQKYDLQPYGKFVIKWQTRQGHLPNIIPYNELRIKHETSMPMTKEQDAVIIKLMKKFKTDILTDDYNTYYTRVNDSLTEVWHEKLSMYKENPAFKLMVDNGHSWGAIMLK